MSFLTFVSDQYRSLPLAVSEQTCAGKTYIVTGANTGLGLEVARHLVSCKAAKVILGCRNLEAAEKARRDIEATTGIYGVAQVWQLDQSTYTSVEAFAKRANSELDRLDAIIENAGIAASNAKRADGHEPIIFTNVLATFLLAALIMPKLSDTARRFKTQAHLVIVASEVAFYPVSAKELKKIAVDPMNMLDDVVQADMDGRYPLSKLVDVLLVRQMAALLPVRETGVVINCANPGLCKTGLSKNAKFQVRIMIRAMNTVMGRTPETGSRPLLYAAVAPETSHGCYVNCCKVAEDRVPSFVTDAEGQEAQRRVWEDIVQELEKAHPGCFSRLIK